jgi:hypothetical protein
MSWARGLEYGILAIIAVIVGVLLGMWLFKGDGSACTDCAVSRPQVRAECDKQFFGTGVRAKQLEAGAEDEFLVAYVDQGSIDPNASTGYSSPTSSYPGVSSTAPAPARGPGYVMVRAQPQFGYDYSGGQSNYGSYDQTSNTRPGTPWNEVTVTVARYVNPLRNEETCGQRAVRYVEGRFETYCEIPNRFGEVESVQANYRVFVRNESSVPVEYCIISNCDASAPYGMGSLCQAEQPAPVQ